MRHLLVTKLPILSFLRSFSRLALPSVRAMSSLPPTKKARTSPLIGTHSGTFHCDEALAVFLLRLLPAYGPSAELVRTRDPALLEDCTVVVDVGGVYDPAALRFDHHQRGFEEVFGMGFSTKLSSAGLDRKSVV